MSRPRIPAPWRDRAFALRAEGASFDRIAALVGATPGSVRWQLMPEHVYQIRIEQKRRRDRDRSKVTTLEKKSTGYAGKPMVKLHAWKPECPPNEKRIDRVNTLARLHTAGELSLDAFLARLRQTYGASA